MSQEASRTSIALPHKNKPMGALDKYYCLTAWDTPQEAEIAKSGYRHSGTTECSSITKNDVENVSP